jgi:hypothetical protein
VPKGATAVDKSFWTWRARVAAVPNEKKCTLVLVPSPCSFAALAIPPRAAITRSPYRIGMRTVVQRPSLITDGKSTFNDSKSCVAPTPDRVPTDVLNVLRRHLEILGDRLKCSRWRLPGSIALQSAPCPCDRKSPCRGQ